MRDPSIYPSNEHSRKIDVISWLDASKIGVNLPLNLSPSASRLSYHVAVWLIGIIGQCPLNPTFEGMVGMLDEDMR